jgi:hypothetical protein
MTIDLKFENDYLPVLHNLQLSDDGMIQFCKHSLDKFSRYVENTGTDLLACGAQDLQGAIDVINSDTDIKVFIANNRTGNPHIQREDFQTAPDLMVVGKTIKLETFQALKQ